MTDPDQANVRRIRRAERAAKAALVPGQVGKADARLALVRLRLAEQLDRSCLLSADQLWALFQWFGDLSTATNNVINELAPEQATNGHVALLSEDQLLSKEDQPIALFPFAGPDADNIECTCTSWSLDYAGHAPGCPEST